MASTCRRAARRSAQPRHVQRPAQGVHGEALNYPDPAYDAAIATGVFSVGHGPANGWDEVARIVKPYGYFVLTMRPDIFEASGFKAKEDALTASGKWKRIETTDARAMLPKGEPGIEHQLRVYQILK